jgi:hypothetical protein
MNFTNGYRYSPIFRPAKGVLFTLSTLVLSLSTLPASAATITDISFTSNGGAYINDTTADGSTSPLAFTATTDLAQPFLNAADSTITLDYGSYYAISFLGFGEMAGPGTVSFLLNGVTPETVDVTFPDPAVASPVFASFTLPGNDSVEISATGLSADRIAISPDGSGLTPDGSPDAFYLFNFTSGSASSAPEPATLAMFGTGAALLIGLRRRNGRANSPRNS